MLAEGSWEVLSPSSGKGGEKRPRGTGLSCPPFLARNLGSESPPSAWGGLRGLSHLQQLPVPKN